MRQLKSERLCALGMAVLLVAGTPIMMLLGYRISGEEPR
jgi:hypothetical protein